MDQAKRRIDIEARRPLRMSGRIWRAKRRDGLGERDSSEAVAADDLKEPRYPGTGRGNRPVPRGEHPYPEVLE